jgi:hypothetical protein
MAEQAQLSILWLIAVVKQKVHRLIWPSSSNPEALISQRWIVGPNANPPTNAPTRAKISSMPIMRLVQDCSVQADYRWFLVFTLVCRYDEPVLWPHLLPASAPEDAARVVDIGTRTLLRWLQMPEFQAAYRQARRAAFGQAVARLQRGTSAAATVSEDRAHPHER